MVYKERKWFYKEHCFILPEDINQQLFVFRQTDRTRPESGGLLLGRRILDTSDCIADKITTPMVGDIQKRSLFFRGKGHHQYQEKYWHNTNTTGQLLGTWHTHPETIPKPSGIDLRDWRMIVNRCGDVDKPLFFIIIGQTDFCIWIGIKRRLKPTFFVQCESQRN